MFGKILFLNDKLFFKKPNYSVLNKIANYFTITNYYHCHSAVGKRNFSKFNQHKSVSGGGHFGIKFKRFASIATPLTPVL